MSDFQPGDRVQVHNPEPRSRGTVIGPDRDPKRTLVQFDHSYPGVHGRAFTSLLRKVEDDGPLPGSPVMRGQKGSPSDG